MGSKLNSTQKGELQFWNIYANDKGKSEAVVANNDKFYASLFKPYRKRLLAGQLCEVGLGPLPYINTIPCKIRIGIDPLVSEYLKLKYHQLENITLRNQELDGSSVTEWLHRMDAVLLLNVLDHVKNPDATLFCCMQILKFKGLFFLFTDLRNRNQVGVMHPTSLSKEWIQEWLKTYNDAKTYGQITVIQGTIVPGREQGLQAYMGIWSLQANGAV